MEKEGIVRAALYALCSTHDKGQDPGLQLAGSRGAVLQRSGP